MHNRRESGHKMGKIKSEQRRFMSSIYRCRVVGLQISHLIKYNDYHIFPGCVVTGIYSILSAPYHPPQSPPLSICSLVHPGNGNSAIRSLSFAAKGLMYGNLPSQDLLRVPVESVSASGLLLFQPPTTPLAPSLLLTTRRETLIYFSIQQQLPPTLFSTPSHHETRTLMHREIWII